MTRHQTAYQREIEAFRNSKADTDALPAWGHLERAHVLSQPDLRLHLHVHWLMLAFAVSRREWNEERGQRCAWYLRL